MSEDNRSSVVTPEVYITRKLFQLQDRIKNTAYTRFAAARRVRFNYDLGGVTIVVLSLWAIAISTVLASNSVEMSEITKKHMEFTGVILPVFIVIFSLMEGGNNFLRSYQLEANARQLRELTDEVAGEGTRARIDPDTEFMAKLFEKNSKKYNDVLERSPINHDDIDYLAEHHKNLSNDKSLNGRARAGHHSMRLALWCRRQCQRLMYLVFWVIPGIPFLELIHTIA